MLSWLGPSNASIESALEGCRVISQEVFDKLDDFNRISDGDKSLTMDFDWMARYPTLHQPKSMFWLSIVDFYLLSYWRRVWIKVSTCTRDPMRLTN